MTSCVCCCRPSIVPKWTLDCSRMRRSLAGGEAGPGRFCLKAGGIRASSVESSGSSSEFTKRMEQAWLISQQPRPISCSSCDSRGNVECKWCAGTGFFILGDNMLCQVPSRNTSCVICAGKGSTCCEDCKGTGYRAKWLGEAPSSK